MLESSLGILRISTSALESFLQFPQGYRIVGVYYKPEFRRLDLTIASSALPDTEEGVELPLLSLQAQIETLPDQKEFRNITTEIVTT